MGTLSRLREVLVSPAGAAQGAADHALTAVMVGYPLAAATHLAYVAFFVAVGVPSLAAYNGASTLWWFAMWLLARSGRLKVTYVMSAIEVILVAAVTVVIVGWNFGIQYFLLVSAVFGFLVRLDWRLSLLGTTLLALEFVGLDVWQRRHPPLVALDGGVLAFVSGFNELCAFLLAAVASYFITAAVQRAEHRLAEAHLRSEALLHDVLPSSIAERLKTRRGPIAENFPAASILFADIVGFTQLSQTMPPAQLVDLLDSLFSRFDARVAARGLEKIKTIGDAYMVAAGIPTARVDHAAALAGLALELREELERFNLERGTVLQVRIGIHTGPVVAGVIGKLRFLYDLWGDAVNTASRMESHGVAGEVQVSEATAALLREGFALEERGLIEVKGKGPMRTWLVRGLRA